MIVQITELQFEGIVCGTLLALGLGMLLVAWWQLKRDKLPPYDEDSKYQDLVFRSQK